MKAYDPLPLIERLIQHRVEFVVIGGVAATLQGAELPTTDLDLMYSRGRENLNNLATALQSLDVRLRGAEELNLTVDAILLRNGDAFTFATSLGDFDVTATATGAPMYDELAKRSTGRATDVPKLAELLELRKLVQEG